MEYFNFKILVQRTGLPKHIVRYRVEQLGLGKKVTETFFLYSPLDVKKVLAYPEKK